MRQSTPSNTSELDHSHDVTLDPNYLCAAYQVIIDGLRDGHYVAQMPNGDVIVTVQKTVELCYRWNQAKNRMERMIPGIRTKRLRKQRQANAQANQAEEDTNFQAPLSDKELEEALLFEEAHS